MHSLVYKGLHNISWYCDLCELPNFSSTLFDTTSFETTNRFDIFNDTPISEGSIGSPTAASSPLDKTPKRSKVKRYDKPLRVVIINCQSVRNKKQELENLVESYNPDIIIGNDSWLNKDIQSSEVFLEGYNCYRKDRGNESWLNKDMQSSEVFPEGYNCYRKDRGNESWLNKDMQSSEVFLEGYNCYRKDRGNESWLNKDMQSSEVFPEGYNCYRKDRKDDTHGGVFVLVSDKYLSTEPPEFRVDGACQLLWVKLQIQGLPDLHIEAFIDLRKPQMRLTLQL